MAGGKMLTKRRLLVFLVDVVFIATAYVCAFLLRFDFNVSRMERELNFFLPGFAVFLASVVSFGALLFVNRTQPFSRAIIILDWLLLFAMMSASRLAWRAYRETYLFSCRCRDH